MDIRYRLLPIDTSHRTGSKKKRTKCSYPVSCKVTIGEGESMSTWLTIHLDRERNAGTLYNEMLVKIRIKFCPNVAMRNDVKLK